MNFLYNVRALTKEFQFNRIASLLLAVAGALVLCSCESPSASSTSFTAEFGETSSSDFDRFAVLLYKPAIQASPITPDPERSGDPEGAALNIVAAMQAGNVSNWLANWAAAERPVLSQEEQQKLVAKWQTYRGSNVEIKGRIVSGLITVIELSLTSQQGATEKLQIPLAKSGERWCLKELDPKSELLHWEKSPNKKVQYVNPNLYKRKSSKKITFDKN